MAGIMMETFEKRLARLEYYQKLLINMVEPSRFPFYQMVIQKGLTEEEVTEVFYVCDELMKEYEAQKQLGFVGFRSLLIRFVGMLHPRLTPKETIVKLMQQGLYVPLMEQLLQTIEVIQKEEG